MSLPSSIGEILESSSAAPLGATSTMAAAAWALQDNGTNLVDASTFSLQFTIIDYTIFASMMLFSALIGVYYGFFKKQDTVSEYLLGGQRMGVFPIAMSLIASNVSGITMLGVPAEMYNFGTQFAMVVVFAVPGMLIIMYWIMPMFYDLQYTSSYEYLEHRFHRNVRHLTSVLFTLGMLLYIPVVIYVPCLALNQVTGISVHLISPLACLVCIFYTSLGGLKAVVWTDALQLLLLCLASIFVIILGVVRLGGLGAVFERNVQGQRIDFFNMDPSLFARQSLLVSFLSTMHVTLAGMGTTPTSVQRYLCVPNIAAARRTVAVLGIGYIVTKVLSCFTGLIILATYYYCDPLLTKTVKKPDQLVPYYVMDVAREWPGLPGLFVAGVFSAALSTMSAVLNTLSGTLYKDFIEAWLPTKVSESRASFIMKMLSLALGAFCVCMIFIVEKLGGVLQVAVSLGGVTGGAMFGLFVLGMFVPWANSKGALAGGVASLVVMAVTVVGNGWAQASGKLTYRPLPGRADGCSNGTLEWLYLHNMSVPLPPSAADLDASSPQLITDALPSTNGDDVFALYRVSYFLFGAMGTVVCVLVGAIVSFLTGPTDPATLEPKLVSPAIRRFLPKRSYAPHSQHSQHSQHILREEYTMVNTRSKP